MTKHLIIGLDLSMNSTGISIGTFEDYNNKTISFFRILFDDSTRPRRVAPRAVKSKSNKKSNKKSTSTSNSISSKSTSISNSISSNPSNSLNSNSIIQILKPASITPPKTIQNVTDFYYKLPTDVPLESMILDFSDENTLEQCEATLKGMLVAKRVKQCIEEKIQKHQPDKIIITIENFIMPAFSGKNQLKTVAGLIMLQGFVRGELIKMIATRKIDFKLMTPSPTSNKLIFTGDGRSDKGKMRETFITIYNGNQLLPTIEEDANKLEDVVDAFSLMVYGYKKIVKLNN